MHIDEPVDLDERIKEAARQAIVGSGSREITYTDQYHFPDSERVRIHFKGIGKRFGVDILVGGHPDFPSDTSLNVLTKQITQELLKHNQNN